MSVKNELPETRRLRPDVTRPKNGCYSTSGIRKTEKCTLP